MECKQKAVTMLDGTQVNCRYALDDDGFILYALHGCEGDVTEISEAEYDNVEAQCLKD